MRILGIVGSPRKNGNTYKMIKWVLDEIETQGAKVEILALSELNIKYCTGCTKCFREGNCPIEDDVEMIHQKMQEADGVIFGAPAYALNVPAQTKTFIDRSSFVAHRPQFIGKFSLVVSPSGAGLGESVVVDYLEKLLYCMGFTCLGKLTAMAFGPGIFPEKEKVISQARQLGQRLIKSIKDEDQNHQVAQNYKPPGEVKLAIQRMGKYLKADYEFWKQKDWID